MARVLAFGVAVVDIVNVVRNYPEEDSEVRALSQSIRRGGNATNTLVVLSQLGHHCSWSGTLAEDSDAKIILDDLLSYNINTENIDVVTDGRTPVSYIIASDNGSRTIVHYRNLPELQHGNVNIDRLSQFDWIHFEGRNIEETAKIMKSMKSRYPQISISLELEKPRKNIESLIAYADHVMYSKQYMLSQQFTDPELFLNDQHLAFSDVDHYCSMGDKGVYGIGVEGILYCSEANNEIKVVDTIGAGDTLNAGLIHASLLQLPMLKKLQVACNLASRKCAQYSFENLDVTGL